MANSILKLKVESQEYDAKLKKAAEGILHLAEVAHRGAGEMTGLDKSEIEFIKSLGDMETKSRAAGGQMRELEKTFKDLKVVYNQLNDVEKADEGGKALAASLERIKERLNESKTQLAEVTKELNATGSESNSTGSILDQLSQKFTINFDAVKLFNTALKAADGAMQVAKDAFFASEATVDEWGRTVEASRSLYEGFLTALNNSDISGYLTRMDQIVEAARAAYNEMDRLGTMKTIQGPAMSAQQAENDRMRQMIMTGRYIAPVDGRNAAPGMVNGQRLTAEQIRAIERNLQGGMQKIVTLVGNEVKQTSKAIDARYSLMAKENGMTLKEFRKGTSSMAEFDKRTKAAAEYEKYERAHTSISTRINPTSGDAETVMLRDNTKNPYEAYKNWSTFRVDKMGEGSYNDLVNLIRQRDQQAAQAYSMQSQAYRTINRAEGTTVRDIMNGKTASTGGGTGGGTTTRGSTPADDIAKAEANYAATMDMAQRDLMENVITQKKYDETIFKGQQDLANAYNKAYEATGDEKYLKAYQETAAHVTEMQGVIDSNIEAQKESEKAARELANAQKKLTDAQNELADAQASGDLKKIYAANQKVIAAGGQAQEIPVKFSLTEDNLDAFKKHLKEQLNDAEIGSDLFNALTSQLNDATMLGDFLSIAMKNGLDTADITPIWEQIFKGDPGDYISDETWQKIKEKLEGLMKDNGISLNFNTGEAKETKKDGGMEQLQKTMSTLNQGISGLSSINSGLAAMGINLGSGIGQAISAMQGVMQVINGVISVIQMVNSLTSFSEIPAQANNTFALYQNTGALWALEMALQMNSATSMIPFMANGGVVGRAASGLLVGTHMSGDNLRMPVVGGGMIGINDGELILNKAQQGVIADALNNNGGEISGGTPYVTGEQIFLGLNNFTKANGYGEIVTSRR